MTLESGGPERSGEQLLPNGSLEWRALGVGKASGGSCIAGLSRGCSEGVEWSGVERRARVTARVD